MNTSIGAMSKWKYLLLMKLWCQPAVEETFSTLLNNIHYIITWTKYVKNTILQTMQLHVYKQVEKNKELIGNKFTIVSLEVNISIY